MLKSPAFVDALGYDRLANTCKIRCVVHAHFDTIWTKLIDQSGQQCRARRLWCLPSASEGICKEGNLEARVTLERFLDRLDLEYVVRTDHEAQCGSHTSSCSDLPI